MVIENFLARPVHEIYRQSANMHAVITLVLKDFLPWRQVYTNTHAEGTKDPTGMESAPSFSA